MRRIEKRTNSAIFLLLMGFSISAIAEPKMLVCENSAEAEEERLRGVATEFRDVSENARGADREERKKRYESYAKDFDAQADVCKNAKYGSQNTFIFDTAGLSSAEFSNVEVQRKSCGGFVSDVLKGTIEATPSIITFSSSTSSMVFNVDRKNLTGGNGTERDFTCTLSDIDTSENLL